MPAEPSCRRAEPSCRRAEPSCRCAEPSCRRAEPSCGRAELSCRCEKPYFLSIFGIFIINALFEEKFEYLKYILNGKIDNSLLIFLEVILEMSFVIYYIAAIMMFCISIVQWKNI